MGVVQNIIGMFRDFDQRRENANIEEVMRNNMNNPDAIYEGIYQIDPIRAQEYQAQQQAARAASEDRAQTLADRRYGNLQRGLGLLRGVRPENMAAAFDRLAPSYGQMGLDEAQLAVLRDEALNNPDFLASLDDEAYDLMMENRYKTHNLGSGATLVRNGEEVYRNPLPYSVTEIGSDATGRRAVAFDPNTGTFPESAGPSVAGVTTPAGAGSTFPTGEAAEAHALASVPGLTAANVTSRERSPERNAAVGGRSDSYHLRSRGAMARDFVPPQGMSMNELYAHLRRAFPTTWDVINEGDHVHIEPGPQAQQQQSQPAPQGGRREVSVGPAPQDRYRPATAEEIAAAGYPAGTGAQINERNGRMTDIRTPSRAGGVVGQRTPDQQAQARTGVTSILGQMVDSYNQLDELNGIRDSSEGTLPNVGAYFRSSGVGQFLGGVIGSEEQALREQILNTQPLLINTIREATGMSARAMDSNRELQFYLQAATDPSGDVISNYAALHVLDSLYGDGTALAQFLPEEAMAQVERQAGALLRSNPIRNPYGDGATPNASAPPQVGEVRNGYRFRGGDPSQRSNWERVQ